VIPFAHQAVTVLEDGPLMWDWSRIGKVWGPDDAHGTSAGDGGWWKRGSCVDSNKDMTAITSGRPKWATAMCDSCPVGLECLNELYEQMPDKIGGFRAGLSEEEWKVERIRLEGTAIGKVGQQGGARPNIRARRRTSPVHAH